MKAIIGIIVSLLITNSVNLYWIYQDFWWHYFFLIGFFFIGFFTTYFFITNPTQDTNPKE